MRYPQGYEAVPNNQFQYRKALSQSSFIQEFYAWRYYIGAYQEKDSTGGWLTYAPANGVIAPAKTAPVMLTVHGPAVAPVEQHVDVLIHSNDPVNPVKKVTVNVRIDQAPYLKTHDLLVVYEADTLRYKVPAVDKEGSPIKAILTDTTAHIINTDTAIYFVYNPGYFDSGMHRFTIILSDTFNNTRVDSIMVHVLNTNRAPVTRHFTKRTIYVGGASLQLALDTVFSDPDKDQLKYTFIGDTKSIVNVYLDSTTGLLNIIANDTGHLALRFVATDVFGASVTGTLFLHARRNVPPTAISIPTQIIEVGSDVTQLNLSKWITDADTGDVLTYSVRIDSANLATATINDSLLLLTGKSAGNTLITVTANDGNGGSTKTSFLLMVLNNKGNIVDDYHINIGPNPFRNNTTIRFELGTSKNVRIEVLGTNGVLHSVLFEGTKQAGFHSINACFAKLAAGNYLVRFTIDGKQGTIQISNL